MWINRIDRIILVKIVACSLVVRLEIANIIRVMVTLIKEKALMETLWKVFLKMVKTNQSVLTPKPKNFQICKSWNACSKRFKANTRLTKSSYLINWSINKVVSQVTANTRMILKINRFLISIHPVDKRTLLKINLAVLIS